MQSSVSLYRCFKHTLQFAFVLSLLSDYNYGKWGSSKDIPGFPEYPPFSFSAKNRKLWVSWNFSLSIKVCCRISSQATWKLCGSTFNFSSLRSFDTESEESRWVVLCCCEKQLNKTESPILLLHFNQLKCESLFALHLNFTLNFTLQWYQQLPIILFICRQHETAHKPFDFCFFLLLFSVNFHISQFCSFWETPTCCRLHTVSPGHIP